MDAKILIHFHLKYKKKNSNKDGDENDNIGELFTDWSEIERQIKILKKVQLMKG